MTGRGLLPLNAALLVLAFSLLTGLASPVPIRAEDAGSSGPVEWAVILSPGPQPRVPWGGYHVTIAGYSKANGGSDKANFLRDEYDSLFQGEPWHLHGNLSPLEVWNGTYTQTFESQILDELANRLYESGFKQIKGPMIAPYTPWHISLTKNSTVSKGIVKKFKNQKTDWYLWLVPKPDPKCQKSGTGCPPWQLID